MSYTLSAPYALKYCPWSSSSSSSGSSSTSSPCCRGSSSSPLLAIVVSPVSTWSMKSRYCHPIYIGRSLTTGIFVPNREEDAIIAKAAEIDEAIVPDEETSLDSDDEISLPLDKLPLDAKLHRKLEQKMKMKLTKKIRLRRKKLMHKRRLRRKGQWPPSKMK